MATLNSRNFFRSIALFVMVVLMVSFASNMAQVYFQSMSCIVAMTDSCESYGSDTQDNTAMAYNNQTQGDEWLCSLGETYACASTTVNSVEVAALGNK